MPPFQLDSLVLFPKTAKITLFFSAWPSAYDCRYPDATFYDRHWRWSKSQVLLPPLAKKLNLSKDTAEEAMQWLETH